MVKDERQVVEGIQKMTPSEAFVETMVAHGVKNIFGIMGSAFMDAMDIFTPAGIRFISVVHEQGAAHMADGYSRASGRQGVVIGQNGPGISNCVTAIAAAYWAHSPVVIVTPEAGTRTTGLGGFQECNQLPMFQEFTKYQAHVNNPARMAEYTGRCFDRALSEMGPTQLNIPRDHFYGEIETEIPRPMPLERGPGGKESLDRAAELLAQAQTIADAVGRSQPMKERIGQLQAEMKAIARIVPQGQSAMFGTSRENALNVHSQASFAGSLLMELGFRVAPPQNGKEIYDISLESLLAMNPDWMFIAHYREESVLRKWEKQPLWQALAAPRKQQITAVNSQLWARSRGLFAAQRMAEQVKAAVEKHR